MNRLFLLSIGAAAVVSLYAGTAAAQIYVVPAPVVVAPPVVAVPAPVVVQPQPYQMQVVPVWKRRVLFPWGWKLRPMVIYTPVQVRE